MPVLSYLQPGLRVALAFVLGRAASRIVVADAPFSFGAVTLAALMVVAAIWLLCDVHTRIVALLGVALYAGYTLMLPVAEAGSHRTALGLALVLGIALPLVAASGARPRRARHDWSDPI
ncbi:hypothetical protein OCH239_13320 [Roseivivax halodurans JCM 10272]|uniref:Uncharacterized protein n=1 Tax=Roseivivax halodurans JCM 10272 TaxID=1449350 RepID=X7EAY9_9RHOB|nr:hypothetical protein [Roseivivax halodurans]ETX13112.1 hypothetical protein OCH239_13320 [Roseivivax halodurans JCM 10272]